MRMGVLAAAVGVFGNLFGAGAATAAGAEARLVMSTPAETDLRPEGVPETQAAWLELIRGARKSIELGQFYVASKPGSQLEPVIGELGKAAARGVKVRMLVSNELLDEDPATAARLRALPGVQFQVYDLEKLTGGIIHSKYWVVDDQIYVGSANFDWRALEHIHETGLIVKDARLARQLRDIFEIDWQVARTGKLPRERRRGAPAVKAGSSAAEFELVASPPRLNPPGTRGAIDALRELLRGAKESVSIQLLDYSPVEKTEFWPEIDNELRAAGQRGVKVRLLVSDWNSAEKKIPHLKSLAVLPNLDVRMATIPPSSKGFIPYARVIHSKLMLVDGKALWVGTSNWGKDYFHQSRNVELITRRPELIAQANAIYAKLWNSAYVQKVDPGKAYVMPVRSEPKPPASPSPAKEGK